MTDTAWTAKGADWSVHFVPGIGPWGTPRVVDRIGALLRERGPAFWVTPTGPYVQARESDPLAVLAVLEEAAGSLVEEWLGTPPPMIEVPPDAVA